MLTIAQILRAERIELLIDRALGDSIDILDPSVSTSDKVAEAEKVRGDIGAPPYPIDGPSTGAQC